MNSNRVNSNQSASGGALPSPASSVPEVLFSSADSEQNNAPAQSSLPLSTDSGGAFDDIVAAARGSWAQDGADETVGEPADGVMPYPSGMLSDSSRDVQRIPLAHLGDAILGCARLRSRSAKTGRIYLEWARRYVLFHGRRHPSDMGFNEVSAFISDLVQQKNVSVATQNQALQALIFLYAKVLHAPLPVKQLRTVRPKRALVLPDVLSRGQVGLFFQHIAGTPRLVAWFQYGCGLKLSEALCLRLSVINVTKQRVVVRTGRRRMRTLAIPSIMLEPLTALIQERQQQWYMDNRRLRNENESMSDIKERLRCAPSPFLFASNRSRRDARTGIVKRHHIDERFIQDSYRLAFGAAGISTTAGAFILRQSYAVHVLDRGGDIRVVQEALGHKDIRTTMRYLQVSNCGPSTTRSPADDLLG